MIENETLIVIILLLLILLLFSGLFYLLKKMKNNPNNFAMLGAAMLTALSFFKRDIPKKNNKQYSLIKKDSKKLD